MDIKLMHLAIISFDEVITDNQINLIDNACRYIWTNYPRTVRYHNIKLQTDADLKIYGWLDIHFGCIFVPWQKQSNRLSTVAAALSPKTSPRLSPRKFTMHTIEVIDIMIEKSTHVIILGSHECIHNIICMFSAARIILFN